MRYLAGIFFLIFAIINARRIRQWVHEGEAYLVVSAAGDGLFGRAARQDQSFAFWLNIAAHCVIVTVAALGGLWILFGRAGF